MRFSPQRRTIFRHRNFKKCSETVSFLTFWLGNALLATAACNFSTSELQKVVRSWRVLYIFTWKCASRHSDVQFFDIGTSKSGPKLKCFVHFHLKMCFSPQRRAIFRHLNFKKCSETLNFLAFWLQNVLLATAACKIFISPRNSYLRTRRFNEPTFRLTRHTNQWKNTAFRDFSNIWRGWIFFLLTFALLHLRSSDFTSSLCFSSAFQLSILSEVYYFRSLTSDNMDSWKSRVEKQRKKMKSREEKSSQKKEDAIARKSVERRSRREKC